MRVSSSNEAPIQRHGGEGGYTNSHLVASPQVLALQPWQALWCSDSLRRLWPPPAARPPPRGRATQSPACRNLTFRRTSHPSSPLLLESWKMKAIFKLIASSTERVTKFCYKSVTQSWTTCWQSIAVVAATSKDCGQLSRLKSYPTPRLSFTLTTDMLIKTPKQT